MSLFCAITDRHREPVLAHAGQLCNACHDRIEKWLTEIPERYALVPSFLMPSADLDENPSGGLVRRGNPRAGYRSSEGRMSESGTEPCACNCTHPEWGEGDHAVTCPAFSPAAPVGSGEPDHWCYHAASRCPHQEHPSGSGEGQTDEALARAWDEGFIVGGVESKSGVGNTPPRGLNPYRSRADRIENGEQP